MLSCINAIQMADNYIPYFDMQEQTDTLLDKDVESQVERVVRDIDERAALEVMGRTACAKTHEIGLTICPTMGCNFDCPYCFEDHGRGKMTPEVQDDVVEFAKRMMDAADTNDLSITWFGGEPLLAPDVIESLSTRLIALTEERGGKYVASIITNGYLLTQENADMLDRCKVSSAQVTIDGMGAAQRPSLVALSLTSEAVRLGFFAVAKQAKSASSRKPDASAQDVVITAERKAYGLWALTIREIFRSVGRLWLIQRCPSELRGIGIQLIRLLPRAVSIT